MSASDASACQRRAALINLPPGAAFDAVAAAARLRELGPSTVIVTLGANGVQLASDGINMHLEAPVVQAVDTTGAGDTFIGAYAAAWCDGASLTAAIEFAQKACDQRDEGGCPRRHAATQRVGTDGFTIRMKKTALLHGELSHLVATPGHGDSVVIADAGLPVPPGARCIDLP